MYLRVHCVIMLLARRVAGWSARQLLKPRALRAAARPLSTKPLLSAVEDREMVDVEPMVIADEVVLEVIV